MLYSVLVPVLLSLGANFYTSEKEAALGRQLAAQTERETTALGITDVDKYIDVLGHRLAAQMPGDPLTWTFRVIRDERGGSTCAPLSFPGGYIFVPVRLILAAKNEDELAGMLAHSMAHVAKRHGIQTAQRGEIANLASIPLIFAGGFGDENMLVPARLRESRRQYELEADQVAAKAMAGAGYDPKALLHFVSRRQQDSTRIAGLEQIIQDLPPGNSAPAGTFGLIQGECRQSTAPRPTLFR